MAQQPDSATPSGWLPDPAGTHQWRYFDGAWTDQVADNGMITRDPLTASHQQPGGIGWPASHGTGTPRPPGPLEAATSPAGRPGQEQRAPQHRRTSRVRLGIGIAVVVAAVITLVLVLADRTGTPADQAGDGSGISGDFCVDFPANYGVIEAAWQTASTISSDLESSKDQQHDAEQLARASALMRRLAAEAPAGNDSFGDPLSTVTGNWADFYAAAQKAAANTNYDDVALHDRLLADVQTHHSESTPSLLKQAMFPAPGLPTMRPCG